MCERPGLCPRWQGGSNLALCDLGRAREVSAQEERGGEHPRHSCPRSQGRLPMVTSGSRNQEHPGRGLSVATGCRCLALRHPRCSWRPAAPAGRGLWPVSVPASRQSGRQSATCNMSGRPEPGNGHEKWKGNITDGSLRNSQHCTRAQAHKLPLLAHRIDRWVPTFRYIKHSGR